MDIEETIRNRKISRKMMNDQASKGDELAGMAEALEHLAEPYFLGVDEDPDSSDLDVLP